MVPHGSTLQSSVLVLGNGVDLSTCVRYGIDKIVQKEGRHPTHPEMFQMTQARTTPDGSVMWSNEQSRQVMDQMSQLMNPTPSDESDGTAHLAVLSPEEAFRQVFGRDRP
ncbi:hypothetical protein Taro_045148 [Colocasia esculenta]|uniref:Uncharacterized protein n=1 Tax=Colocasia esculenta TaxID=4460 RepID=A0A843WQG5_COLES|nr:hypothetical protein [Colocasia esculenta]